MSTPALQGALWVALLLHEIRGEDSGEGTETDVRGEGHGNRSSETRGVHERAGCERREGASQEAERGAVAEEAAADGGGDQVAHPRDPGIVPNHREHTGEGDDRDEDGPFRLQGNRQKGEGREQENHLSRGTVSDDRDAPAAEPRREPRGGDLHDLPEIGQRP